MCELYISIIYVRIYIYTVKYMAVYILLLYIIFIDGRLAYAFGKFALLVSVRLITFMTMFKLNLFILQIGCPFMQYIVNWKDMVIISVCTYMHVLTV